MESESDGLAGLSERAEEAARTLATVPVALAVREAETSMVPAVVADPESEEIAVVLSVPVHFKPYKSQRST